MKSKIIMFWLTIFLGISSVCFMNNTKVNGKTNNYIYILQVGAFKNINNANKVCNEFLSCIVIKEDKLYKSIIGVYSNKKTVNKIVSKYNFNIFVRKSNSNLNTIRKINKLERNLFDKDNSLVADINNKILNIYLESNNYE